MPFPLIPVLSGLGTLLNFGGGLINSQNQVEASRYNTDKTIQANKEAAQFAYQKDLEQWNRANQYNDPTSQMGRMRAAGLNPMLAYGQGSIAANTAAQQSPRYNPPQQNYAYQAPQIPPISPGAFLAETQNFQLQKAQIDQVKAQTRATEQSTANAAIQGALLEIDKLFRQKEKTAGLTTAEASARYADRRELLDILLKQAQTAATNQATSQSVQSFPYQLEYQKGSIAKQQKEIASIMETIKTAPYQRRLTEASTGKTIMDTHLSDEHIRTQQLQRVLMDKDALIKQWEIFLNEHGTYKGDTPWGQGTRRGSKAFEEFINWLENKFKN